MSEVTEQTKTLNIVGQVTNVVLGLAITTGFIVSGFAYEFIIPVKGGGTTGASALAVSQVTAASSTLEVMGTFQPLYYRAGATTLYTQTNEQSGYAGNTTTTNQPLKIVLAASPNSNSNTSPAKVLTKPSASLLHPIKKFGIIPIADAQATSFSIEPENPLTFPTQMVLLTYGARTRANTLVTKTLTVCIGSTASTTLYVGSDGTTYTSMNTFGVLSGPTSESCSAIVRRALKPISLTAGRMVAQASAWPTNERYTFFRGQTALAHLDPLNDFQPGQGTASASANDPLMVSPEVNSDPTDLTLPASFVTLTGQNQAGLATTMTLCMPPMTILGNGYRVIPYFFANDGTAYSDIFLSQLVVDYGDNFTTCPAAQAKALKYSQLSSGTIASEKPTDLGLAIDRSNILMAGFNGTTFHQEGTVTPQQNMNDPVTVEPTTSEAAVSVTYPRSLMNLTGTDLNGATAYSTTLCVPEMTWNSQDGTAPRLFYDTTGTPYNDIFLLQPAMSGTCAATIQHGLKFGTIESASTSPAVDPHLSNPTFHALYLYNKGTMAGQVNSTWWHLIDQPQGTPHDFFPFLMLVGGGDPEEVFDVPTVGVTITHDSGQKQILCFPGKAQIKTGDISKLYSVFYDSSGQPYSDLFLSQPVTCDLGGGGGDISPGEKLR